MAAAGDLRLNNSTPHDRRDRRERRNRRLWSLIYGNFKPRRRRARRSAEHHVQFVDWHDAHLLGVAIAVLLLSCVDGFLTLNLMTQGAHEANPMMAGLLQRDVSVFAGVKMALTGCGVVMLVALSRCRVFGRIRVYLGLYLTLAAYVLLIGYELTLIDRVA